jgi:hypothetical protein
MSKPELATRDAARMREHLERIAEAANNPECYACTEVRRLARGSLESSPPPLDTWQT